ncbi:sigma-54 interaction domain-containing protein [Lutimonas zeaxanthinifaciens]|uniref:sigma-54 interaction domain-containing protein n=1 Tax=Lutimonas zeaxanthinifaciens TaxID=3060215 RepID=UPI00265D2F65|nr:sigma 54-interacting transcriptional regulator [Lutimonas sp. YSD2104]WKK65335.1 sigma 54-interacting transcriptional regulator [Lutimonas sp. YSD2104]
MYQSITYFIIGIYMAFSIGQLLFYFFSKKSPVNLLMSLLGFVASCYLYFSVQLHSIESLEFIGKILPYHISFYLIQMMFLFAILQELNAPKKRLFLNVLLGFTGFLIILNLIFPNSLIYQSITALDRIMVLNQDYNLLIGEINPYYFPVVILSYLLYTAFLIYQIYLATRKKSNSRRIIFTSIAGVYLLSNIYDVLVDLRVIQGVYLTEYFMLPVLLLLNLDIFIELRKGSYFESSLKNVQQNFNSLIESVGLIVIAVDPKGNILYANPFFFDFSGYKEREVLNKSFKELMVSEQNYDRFDTMFSKVISDKDELKIDFEILDKKANKKVVSWSNVPIIGIDGDVQEILTIGADITEKEKNHSLVIEANQELIKLRSQLEDENTFLKENLRSISNLKQEMIGESVTMKYVFRSIDEVAKTDTSVLIEGETGVGKELVARSIHDKSNRFDQPYVKVNCGALPKDLIESELFGHVKGAFTGAINARKGRFELADGGTIFLDEIGELPLDLQAKLLRVLENSEFNPLGSEKLKRVDVRVVAATNRNLKEFTEEGFFRSDLYYRLSVFPITVPPLRNRIEDIPLLVEHFLEAYCDKLNVDPLPVSVSTVKKLKAYSWPGNVRELKNVIERSVISSMNRKKLFVDAAILKENPKLQQKEHKSLIEVEREYIISILNETGWKISGKGSASAILDINEATLRSKMKKLGISRTGMAPK